MFAPESEVAALIRAQQFVESEPNSVEAHFEHALALCRLSQWEQAAVAWQNVVRLEPGNAFAYINMGVVHLEQAQWTQAEQAFRHALYLQPHQPAAHYGLGAACAQQGQLDAARAAWEQTLRLSPDHAEAQSALDELNLLAREDALPPVECVITSQINLHLPSPAQAPAAAQAPARAETPVSLAAPDAALRAEKPAAATQSHRIKLPQFNGPNLTSIADVVMAAQYAPRPDDTVHNAAEAPGKMDSIAPTLRLDTKEIRAAHRGMRGAHLPLSSRRALLGTGLACIVGLLVWATQRPRTPVENTAPSARMTFAALPVTSSNPTTLPNVPAPSSSLSSSDMPSASAPDRGQAAASEQDQIGVRQTTKASTQVHDETPASRTAPKHFATARHRRTATVAEDGEMSHRAVSRPVRVPQARSVAASSADMPHSRQQNSTRTWQAPGVRRRRSGGNGEEDTFAAHTTPAHSVNGDEWTDKLP